MRLFITALVCLISESLFGQELKFIDGDIFLNSKEIFHSIHLDLQDAAILICCYKGSLTELFFPQLLPPRFST